MTKKVIDYSKTIIYKIVCNDLEKTEVYVGHTTDFTKRKYGHKSTCYNEKNKNHNLKIYQYIRENGGWDNFSMIEIEKYTCNDGNEARARERYWFETLNAKLNMFRPISTEEEKVNCVKLYFKEHQEEIHENRKLYREEHREELCEKSKLYNKEHQEEIKQYKKLYYKENHEEISEKAKQKYICDCGGKYTKPKLSRHTKSKKHQNYIQAQNIIQ